MNLQVLVPKVFECTKQRLKGVCKADLENNPSTKLDSNEFMLNYGGGYKQCYYFDYHVELQNKRIGLEGGISNSLFRCAEYTDLTIPVFELDISEMPSVLEEGDFFQMSLVENLGSLTCEQLNSILEIRDIIRNAEIDWNIE